MSRKSITLGTLALICLGLGTARAEPPASDGYEGPVTSAPGAPPAHGQGGTPAVGLSRWIVGTEPDCCGPLSDRTPLRTELFIRSGVSLPFGDGYVADRLEAGWAIAGGGRALCFNEAGDAAFTVEASLMNIYNRMERPLSPVLLFNLEANTQAGSFQIPEVVTALEGLNRTFVNIGAGGEWYLFGSANGTRTDDGAVWRFGLDGGGRYGSAKAELSGQKHRDDVIGGAYVAAHTDMDIPCGCCTFYVGFRAEWDYTWTDVLQIQNKSEFQELNLLATFGVRY